MVGPDCDWCGAEEEDMDVFTVGDDFICEECYFRLTNMTPELFSVVQELTSTLKIVQKLHDRPGIMEAAIKWGEMTISLAKGERDEN